jgi:hypothetical protein
MTSVTTPTTPATRRRRRGLLAPTAAVLALGLVAAACGDDEESASTTAETVAPADGEEALEFDESIVVGLSVEEAETAAEEAGFTVRIARQDGEDLALTMDFIPNRVNVEVEDGVVTGVVSVG